MTLRDVRIPLAHRILRPAGHSHRGIRRRRACDPFSASADEQARLRSAFVGVSDGTRTRDILDHNQGLYQLSYTHHRCPASLGNLRSVAEPGRPHRIEIRDNEFVHSAAGPGPFEVDSGMEWTKGLGRPRSDIQDAGSGRPVRAASCRAAICLAVALSGPGSDTNTASR